MHCDIVDLKGFYSAVLGRLAERSIGMGLSALWVPLPEERLVGIGYATPWLDRFGPDAERAFAFMPAAQGALCWPGGGPVASALVLDEQLPLADSTIDRMLMVHHLEHVENPLASLLEAWRVLVPGGRLVIVVPNRRGLWARFEHTPFGTGQPYSRTQLTNLLQDAGFTPLRWSDALHFPPFRRQVFLQLYQLFERFGRRLWPIFSGVVIVEAQKLLYQGSPVKARNARRILVPVLAPQQAQPG